MLTGRIRLGNGEHGGGEGEMGGIVRPFNLLLHVQQKVGLGKSCRGVKWGFELS